MSIAHQQLSGADDGMVRTKRKLSGGPSKMTWHLAKINDGEDTGSKGRLWQTSQQSSDVDDGKATNQEEVDENPGRGLGH